MTSRTVWLAVALLVAACVSLEIAVNGAENTRLDVQTVFFRTLFSPVALLTVIVAATVFAALGIWLADYKLRSPLEGFDLGFFLGPLGILIEAALPDLGAHAEPGLQAKGGRSRRSPTRQLPTPPTRLAAGVGSRYHSLR